MDGTIRALSIKFRGICKCQVCGKEAESHDSNTITAGMFPVSDLHDFIDRTVKDLFIQPPFGWASYGRGNYKCEGCKT